MVPTLLPMDMDTEPMELTPILTMERGPLMLSPRLMPLSSMELTAMLVFPMLGMPPTELTPMLMEPTPMFMVSPLDPALVRTPSPRDSMLRPRDMFPTDTPHMAGESKFFSRECNCQTNYYL